MNVSRWTSALAIVGLMVSAAAAQQPGVRAMNPDQVKMAVQDICPVSGNKLGAHGQPIKVKLGEETLFLCCQGCTRQRVNPQHWATIHANFARAQGICPIMKKPLPKSPKWTVINGQLIYVCCPPCGKKLQSDPAAAVAQLNALYQQSLSARQR